MIAVEYLQMSEEMWDVQERDGHCEVGEGQRKMMVVVMMYYLLLFFHLRTAKHPTITVVALCLSDAHDVGSDSSETLVRIY